MNNFLMLIAATEERDRLRKELAALRLSLRRVSELAKQKGGSLAIPEDGAERGWNRLCAGLADFIESLP